MDKISLRDHLEFMVEVARVAGAIQLKYFGNTKLEKNWITRTNFSTAADKEVGEITRPMLMERYPSYNILSEELPDLQQGSRYTWVEDELDGTLAFRTLMDMFTFCLALCEDETPIAGVVFAPKRGELYTAAVGLGAYLNGVRITVSDEMDVNRVQMGVDSGKATKADPLARTRHVQYLERLYTPDGVTYPWSMPCASIPLCFVARGEFQAYMATGLAPEDMAAAACIIREAGGKVTNHQGEEWSLRDPSVLTANPVLHEKFMKIFGFGGR